MLVNIQNFAIPRRGLLLIIILSVLTSNRIYSQSSPNLGSKRGGICFRTDDNQSIEKYLEYASIFNKYNQKFTFAINLESTTITSDYLNGIRQMQVDGHEMMDHTPTHGTNFFRTILSPDYFLNHPGVHEISGNKIMIKHSDVDISFAKRKGYVNISRDTITSTSGAFGSFSLSDCYLYFPSLDKLVFIHQTNGWIDQNTVKVTDFWLNAINLGSHQNIRFYNFDYYNIHLTVEGLKALFEESNRLANNYNLQRPQTWIQPGSYSPHVHRNEIQQVVCDELEIKYANVYPQSLKIFNEYNPDNNKQFGMGWGNFKEDTWSLNSCKALIADRIAKHHVLIGHSHFSNLLDGWSGFLNRTEQLIQWCIANNIPIRTYSEWGDILYNQIPNPNENIFPPLNVDLDSNNVPDGYNETSEGILSKSDGFSAGNYYCYSINRVGEICSVTKLGGIEKGANEFEIWTKGSPGNFIEVVFSLGTNSMIYKFSAETFEWTKYNLAQSINGNTILNIPDSISLIDLTIKCSDYSFGEVKVSGMKLAKSSSLPVELSGFTASVNQNIVLLKWQTKTEVNNYGFEVERASSITSPIQGWEKIGFVPGYGNSNSPKDYSFIDKNPLGGSKFIYRLKQFDNDGKSEYSDEVEIILLPKKFVVHQNYPNPFNPSTTIRFSLPLYTKVTIQIYNQLGEIVAQPEDNFYEAGNYAIDVNLSNSSSGVYFYRITAGAFSEIKKMMLTK